MSFNRFWNTQAPSVERETLLDKAGLIQRTAEKKRADRLWSYLSVVENRTWEGVPVGRRRSKVSCRVLVEIGHAGQY